MFVKNNRFLPFIFQTFTTDKVLHCQYLELIYLMSKKAELVVYLSFILDSVGIELLCFRVSEVHIG